MRFIESLPFVAVLVAPAFAQVKRQSPAEASSVLSEVEALITQIPSAIVDGGSDIASGLANILSQVDPSGVVGDVPSIISSELPVIETLLDQYLTAVIPSGVVASSIIAEIPTFISQVLPALESDVDSIFTQFPSTLPLTAVPALITSYITQIGSELEADASALLPALSSFLFNPTAAASVASSATRSPVSGSNSTASITSSTSPKPSAYTGAGASWKAEIGIVAGFAAVVALL